MQANAVNANACIECLHQLPEMVQKSAVIRRSSVD
jgi:hypothetical protein